MASIQTIHVNVFAKPEARRLLTFLVLSQNENGRTIVFRILGADLPNGATATFSGVKPDGNVYSTSGTVSGNYITIEEDVQMTAVAGTWDAKLDIVASGRNIMTAIVRVTIDADPVPAGAVPSDTQLEGLIAQAKYYAENARSDAYGSPLVAQTASAMIDQNKVYVYTGSETGYSTGYWYYYNTTNSTWTAGGPYNGVAVITDDTLTQEGMAADAAAVGDAISQLNADITNKESNIFGLNVIEYTSGYYINTGADTIDETPVASSGWSYARFNCPPNYRVSIIGYGSSGGRLYCFFDANGNVLEKASGTANSGGDGVMKTYVSPANTAYCIVNSSNRYATKYIVVSPLHNDVMHHRPSTLITDTTVTLESVAEGFYRINSSIASQLSWSPTTSSFNLLINSRSIYPNVTTERFAFAVDTYSRTYINVAGSSGYTGWHQISYVDSYPTIGTVSEYSDTIINSSGVLVPSSVAISHKEFISDTVVGFQVTDSTIKVAVNRYTLTGAHSNKQYWYLSSNTLQDGKYHYKFDHTAYKYRIYIFNSDESTIHDKAKLVNGVRLYENIDVIEHYTYHDADYDTFKKQYNFDNISTRLRLIQEANYQLSFANATDWMKLYSYYGDTQVVHPKVLYFEDGLFGHKYWMAYTPYPNANAYYENPCIAWSDDGYRFTNIEGNPIDEPTTDRTTTYYSDTHLVYNSDTGLLECWYRLANETNMTESLYRMTSADGITWSNKALLKTINSGDSISKFLSPAVIYEDSKYKVWTVNYSSNQIEYWEYNGTSFSWKKNISLTFTSDGETHRIWHIDVEKIDGVYVLVAMTRQSGTRHWPLYVSTSTDNTTWETPWVVIKYADTDKWDSRIYRSCIVYVDGVYRIYYSAYDTSNQYHMAISESSDLHHFCGRDVVY